ncbi:FAD-dependent monooxygenase [Cryobacterium sp. TMT1-66-1]|uniref:FAD-dependent monooxygenase n=1 Tax=Cryobacterium sp. TMT1-66-1 TaxID=1259242 RepID=UPI00141B3295|nr:FAD-dependent monooxygenase [Cryobacterium sp. TMT1-66-1]
MNTSQNAPFQPRPARPGEVDVLVVGAGPTGLTAACEALRHGLSVRIIDRKQGRSTHSKALVTHARTLEVFETMGVADGMLAGGVPFAALNAHGGPRRRTTRVDLLGLPWGDTAYPFWLSIPQDATEQVLEDHLNRLGGAVEWGTSFDEILNGDDQVEALVTRDGGETERVSARWLIGCDGGRSRVRDQVGLRLTRRDAGATFVLADVKSSVPIAQNEGYAYLDPQGLLLVVPMPEPERWRIIAHVPTPDKGSQLTVDAAFLDELIRQRSGMEFGSRDVKWTSQFNLSHGLANHFRSGRVFLAGDAAHIHSPVGGQGLNTGVQDAHNLLWKLAAVDRLDSAAAERLLDSYEAERRDTARGMVTGVARVTTALTTRRTAIRRALGRLAPRILARSAVQSKLGRTAGMLDLAYSSGPLATAPGAGRRLPNPELPGGGRLYERLSPAGWSWVVWGRPGEARPDLSTARWHGLPVVFIASDLVAPAGAPATAAMPDGKRVALVRPDRYVAARGSSPESIGQHILQSIGQHILQEFPA